MITCIIVDDEPLATDVLKRYVNAIPDLSLAGVFEKPMEAFVFLQKQKVDLMFLDIQMPGLTGVELIKALKDPPKVILTTAYRDFAVEGFELNVMDYLVKPIGKDRFLQAIDKYYTSQLKGEETVTESETFTFLKVEKQMVRLNYQDVLFVEALKNYSRIKTTGKDLIVYYPLSYLEERLPSHIFRRVHKSFIVNLNRIDNYSNGFIGISGNEISVGKTYQADFEQLLRKRSI